jgi:hypothetical protein
MLVRGKQTVHGRGAAAVHVVVNLPNHKLFVWMESGKGFTICRVSEGVVGDAQGQ